MTKEELRELLEKFNGDDISHILNNTEFLKENNTDKIIDLIKGQNSDIVLKIINDYDLVKKCKLSDYDIYILFETLEEEKKIEFLSNAKYIKEKLMFPEMGIAEIISSINNEKAKEELMKLYELGDDAKEEVIKELSDEEKERIVLSNKFDLKSKNIEKIMTFMKTDNLIQLINNNIEFFRKSNIKLYKVVEKLIPEKQKEFVSKIDELQLSNVEKRIFMVVLKSNLKNEIDTQDIPEELKSALQVKYEGEILLDFEEQPEYYIGLDELINVEPMNLSEEERKYLLRLCEICPNMNIWGSLKMEASTPNEYIQGEKHIEEFLKEINPEWSDIQKVAYIDNWIGKNISYDPKFETEVTDTNGDRNLWKILSNGYGVCDGIAQVENYILGRIGIEGEEVTGKNHAFIKLKNIELPQKDGSSVIGDTILDPTWNLSAQRFGAEPSNFCISYEEIRKNDIDESGQDQECHKNDKELESANIGLDIESLREVYKQIGIADENGDFPIKNIFDESEKIYKLGLKSGEYLPRILKLLQEMYPDFAHSINETTSMLYGLLDNENFNYEKCVIKRVYKRSDKEKMANLYVYADFGEDGKVFYVADRETGEFVELEQRDFEEQYECYQMDLDRSGGIRPWESVEKTVEIKNLTQSSGKVVACEGEER